MDGPFYKNLYEDIMLKFGRKAKKIHILSGYASPFFLEMVLSDLTNIEEIILYLGMTPNGLNVRYHEEFKRLAKSFEGILTIYYQYTFPVNHMKCYQFFDADNNVSTFIGSSNFSENGFLLNKEILTQCNQIPDFIFEEQLENSINCLDSNVNLLIYMAEGASHVSEIVDYSPSDSVAMKTNRLTSSFDPSLLDDFCIDIMYSYDKKTHLRGINANFRGHENCIEDSPGKRFDTFFPLNDEFYIFLNGIQILAEVKSGVQNRLVWKNFDMRSYFLRLTHLSTEDIITFEHLKKFNLDKLYLKKINEKEFFARFGSAF